MVMNLKERKGVCEERGGWIGRRGPHIPQEQHVLPLLPTPDPSFSSAGLIEEPAVVTVKGF